MNVNVWGLSSEKIDSKLKASVIPVKSDKIARYLNLTRTQLNVLLTVHVKEGIGTRELLTFIPSLFGYGQKIQSLLDAGYLREVKVIKSHSFNSSRKFYLTGKGREIVSLYYQLMEC